MRLAPIKKTTPGAKGLKKDVPAQFWPVPSWHSGWRAASLRRAEAGPPMSSSSRWRSKRSASICWSQPEAAESRSRPGRSFPPRSPIRLLPRRRWWRAAPLRPGAARCERKRVRVTPLSGRAERAWRNQRMQLTPPSLWGLSSDRRRSRWKADWLCSTRESFASLRQILCGDKKVWRHRASE